MTDFKLRSNNPFASQIRYTGPKTDFNIRKKIIDANQSKTGQASQDSSVVKKKAPAMTKAQVDAMWDNNGNKSTTSGTVKNQTSNSTPNPSVSDSYDSSSTSTPVSRGTTSTISNGADNTSGSQSLSDLIGDVLQKDAEATTTTPVKKDTTSTTRTPETKVSTPNDSVSTPRTNTGVSTNSQSNKTNSRANQVFSPANKSTPEPITIDTPKSDTIPADSTKTLVSHENLNKGIDYVSNYSTAVDSLGKAVGGLEGAGLSIGAGYLAAFADGARVGSDISDITNNYENRTDRENYHSGAKLAEDATGAITGVVGVSTGAGAAIYVGGKAAVRTISQTGEQMYDIYKSNDSRSTKIAKGAEVVNNLDLTFGNNAGHVIAETVGGVVKGATSLFGYDSSEAVNKVVDDTKEIMDNQTNIMKGMRKNGGKVIGKLVTGDTQSAKDLYKESVGEDAYNMTKNVYHAVDDAVDVVVDTTKEVANDVADTAKKTVKNVVGEENYNAARETYHEAKNKAKEVVDTVKDTTKKAVNTATTAAKKTATKAKEKTKEVVHETVHSEPVQKTVKAVESLPGGKTVVNTAKKVYHWFGF